MLLLWLCIKERNIRIIKAFSFMGLVQLQLSFGSDIIIESPPKSQVLSFLWPKVVCLNEMDKTFKIVLYKVFRIRFNTKIYSVEFRVSHVLFKKRCKIS